MRFLLISDTGRRMSAMDNEHQDDETMPVSPAAADRGGSLSGIRAALDRSPPGSAHWGGPLPRLREPEPEN